MLLRSVYHKQFGEVIGLQNINFPFYGNRGIFLGGKRRQGVNICANIHLASSLRMSGVIPLVLL